MSDSPSPGPSDQSTPESLKRKWTMKTWVGTDPSSTAPVVDHRDPKAAARAERKRIRRKEKRLAAKAPPTHRLIRGPPTQIKAVNSDYIPPQLPEGLIPMHGPDFPKTEVVTDDAMDESTDSSSFHDGPQPQPAYPSVDVKMDAPSNEDCNASGDADGDNAALSPGRMSVDSTMSGGTNESLDTATSRDDDRTTPIDSNTTPDSQRIQAEYASPLRDLDHVPQGGELTPPSAGLPLRPPSSSPTASNLSDMSVDVAHSFTSRVPAPQAAIIDNASADELALATAEPSHRMKSGDADGDKAPIQRDAAVTDALPLVRLSPSTAISQVFNTGWRRYGPRGQDILGYAPRFPGAPAIEWPTRLTTGLPYLPDDRRGRGRINKLQWDQDYVTNVARTLKSSRDRPDLCLHVKYTTDKEAIELIRLCNATGKPLVFDDFPDSLYSAHAGDTFTSDPYMDTRTWSADPCYGVVGANLRTPRDFQDAGIRERKPLKPYVTATLRDFRTWLDSPSKIRCILDLTCGFPQPDRITDRIADNIIESTSQTYGNKYSGHFTIVADMLRIQDWFLLHTSGFLTFGHIDASGMATSAQIRGGGMKQWFLFAATDMPRAQPGDTRERRLFIQSQLLQRVLDLIKAASTDTLEPPKDEHGNLPQDWKVDGCIVELRPGMKLYQPAGTVHGAFTPVPTAASGKHFFTYDDLHRMEVSRRVQLRKKGITNHNHNCGVQLMLIAMAAALPMRVADGQRFYRKPMIALALMLTRPQDYLPEPEDLHDIDAYLKKINARGPHTQNREAKIRAKVKQMEAENAERVDEFRMTQRLRADNWAEDGTAFDRLAYTVAMRILLACKTKYPGDARAEIPGPEYVLEGGEWDDPGPRLSLERVLDDLTAIHVDDIVDDSASDSGSDSDSDLTEIE